MSRLLSFVLLMSVVTFMGCPVDEDLSILSIDFKATYDGEPLVMLDEEYTYPDGSPLKIQLFNYYISNLRLGTADDDNAVTLTDLFLVDYGQTFTRSEAELGVNFSYEGVEGTFESLSFGLGVSEDLNATTPSDYPAGHPLSQNHWSGLGSYVFAKIEGSSDLNGDGLFDDKLTYHMGKNDLFVDLKFDEAITVARDGLTSITITVDLKNVLEKEGNYIDIADEANQADHTNDPGVYEFFWNNLAEAFTLSK